MAIWDYLQSLIHAKSGTPEQKLGAIAGGATPDDTGSDTLGAHGIGDYSVNEPRLARTPVGRVLHRGIGMTGLPYPEELAGVGSMGYNAARGIGGLASEGARETGDEIKSWFTPDDQSSVSGAVGAKAVPAAASGIAKYTPQQQAANDFWEHKRISDAAADMARMNTQLQDTLAQAHPEIAAQQAADEQRRHSLKFAWGGDTPQEYIAGESSVTDPQYAERTPGTYTYTHDLGKLGTTNPQYFSRDIRDVNDIQNAGIGHLLGVDSTRMPPPQESVQLTPGKGGYATFTTPQSLIQQAAERGQAQVQALGGDKIAQTIAETQGKMNEDRYKGEIEKGVNAAKYQSETAANEGALARLSQQAMEEADQWAKAQNPRPAPALIDAKYKEIRDSKIQREGPLVTGNRPGQYF